MPADHDARNGVGRDAGGDGATDPARVVPTPVRAACTILLLEALALLAAAGFLLFDTAAGSPHSVAGALFAALGAVLGSAVIALGARGLWHLRPAARTPIVVLQLLALPVAYSLAFQAGLPGYGGPILVAALAVLYLLFTPPARAVLDREPPR